MITANVRIEKNSLRKTARTLKAFYFQQSYILSLILEDRGKTEIVFLKDESLYIFKLKVHTREVRLFIYAESLFERKHSFSLWITVVCKVITETWTIDVLCFLIHFLNFDDKLIVSYTLEIRNVRLVYAFRNTRVQHVHVCDRHSMAPEIVRVCPATVRRITRKRGHKNVLRARLRCLPLEGVGVNGTVTSCRNHARRS